jgi:hypothetical protein
MRHAVTALIRIATVLTLVLGATAAHAAQHVDLPLQPELSVLEASAIPPNCTLNPWTHKYVCHKWPKKRLAAAL